MKNIISIIFILLSYIGFGQNITEQQKLKQQFSLLDNEILKVVTIKSGGNINDNKTLCTLSGNKYNLITELIDNYTDWNIINNYTIKYKGVSTIAAIIYNSDIKTDSACTITLNIYHNTNNIGIEQKIKATKKTKNNKVLLVGFIIINTNDVIRIKVKTNKNNVSIWNKTNNLIFIYPDVAFKK